MPLYVQGPAPFGRSVSSIKGPTLVSCCSERNYGSTARVRQDCVRAALGMIGLTYSLARRIAGREAALAGGFFLVSNPFFVLECRQGGNDPPLAFFTTLALYAAWRRLADVEIDGSRSRRWNLLLYLSMGSGFLTKGPIVVVIVAATIIGYLASARRIRAGARRLWDAWGCGLFVVLAMCWPLPVCLVEPRDRRLAFGNGSKDDFDGHRRGGQARTLGARLAGPDRALDLRDLGGRDVAVCSKGPRKMAGCLVPLVVRLGQFSDVLLLAIGQAELLLALFAGRRDLVGNRLGRLVEVRENEREIFIFGEKHVDRPRDRLARGRGSRADRSVALHAGIFRLELRGIVRDPRGGLSRDDRLEARRDRHDARARDGGFRIH